MKPLAKMARDTTRDNPWPLRLLSENIKAYVERMSELWVEGQVVQFNERPPTKMSFLTIRDVDADVSMNMTAFGTVIAQTQGNLTAGSRIVARVKPVFWTRSGRLNLQAKEIHPVGVGNLLAQIEQLRKKLDAEGLFAASRKKPLPFLPRTVGLICGRNAKAKDDVIVNARLRWPATKFEIREVLVQGPQSAAQVSRAITELDGLEHVDVIIVARGGGSVEDLLPFSEEIVVRAAADAHTPIVSAIGHEGDAPLLDLAADLRASTPTDAAKKTVPDLEAEGDGLAQARARLRQAVLGRIGVERNHLELLTSRPVFTSPTASLQGHRATLEQALTGLRNTASQRLSAARTQLASALASLRAMSPQATLERGYSILKAPGTGVLTDAAQVKKGEILQATLARGSMIVTVFGTNPGKKSGTNPGEKPGTNPGEEELTQP
ncbi:exodeoxyribonuclease VII large subunit [Gleimia hominis]|uniref:Exodeoxyribonuclease 7 large subunit n=1 Tax=Gleimia hominis TaxID=595468 RepID=A0ABU3IC51_9ACTO|nr:exodeoxyribonuclease VII large subunit [Gleimia hominis]MDT3767838.1 exodeoxyribonuclease VII large subunit [Gleimia hominis]